MRHLSESEYRAEFGIDPPNLAKRRRALSLALDTRKFEIEHYWKRAAYFWTFIGAALAAYGAIQVARDVPARSHLSVLVGSLGLVFSFAWCCVNRGSKRWQENWENHVDLLEDVVTGPLYKTVIGRPPIAEHIELGPPSRRYLSHALTGPSDFSVSKINQIVSVFVTALWIPMIWLALGPFDPAAAVDWFAVVILGMALTTCSLLFAFGRSDSVDYSFVVQQRTSRIVAGPSGRRAPTDGTAEATEEG